MSSDLIKLCRACGKKNYVFCNVSHEVILRLLKFVPGLIEMEETKLPPDICVECFQMIKTLVFNIEGISDMQKILKIQCGSSLEAQATPVENKKRSLVEDIRRKYTNIKFRKIEVGSTNEETSDDLPIVKKVLEKSPVKNLSPPSTPKTQEKEKSIPSTNSSSPQTKTEPKPKKAFMCITCTEKFTQFSDLESHLKNCKSTTNQQYKCFCGKVLKSKPDLSVHISVVHKQNKQQHICSTCKKVFSSLANLQNHVMMIHNKSPHGKLKGSYMCHICDEKFTELETLIAHRQSTHTIAKKLAITKKSIET